MTKKWLLAIFVIVCFAIVSSSFWYLDKGWERRVERTFTKVGQYAEQNIAEGLRTDETNEIYLRWNHGLDADLEPSGTCHDSLIGLPKVNERAKNLSFEECLEQEDLECIGFCSVAFYLSDRPIDFDYFFLRLNNATTYREVMALSGNFPRGLNAFKGNRLPDMVCSRFYSLLFSKGEPPASNIPEFASFAILNAGCLGDDGPFRKLAKVKPETVEEMLFFSRAYNFYHERPRI